MIWAYVKGNKISNASIQRKKLSLKGDRSDKNAIFPEKKFPDQKNEEAIKRTMAKTKFLDIYLSTNVISEEVSRRLPPFFWTSS